MDFLDVFPIHKKKPLMVECCDLINSEWPRSKTARLQSLYMSSEKFPTSLVLIRNGKQVVGHVKLTEIKLGGTDIMLESMIIHKDHRGKGWGKVLMEEAEKYIKTRGKRTIYLSTRGQEGFYKKLGYEVCEPIMYFGYCDITPKTDDKTNKITKNNYTPINVNVPIPPPLPQMSKCQSNQILKTTKTFMRKDIY